MALDPAIKEGAPVGYDDLLDPLRARRPAAGSPGPPRPFQGKEPDAPKWFTDAIAQEPERSFVTSLGTQIEVLTWGEIGKPGLLLAHGNSAHADWWSFIAPYLAQDFRVASMSLAGMGASELARQLCLPGLRRGRRGRAPRPPAYMRAAESPSILVTPSAAPRSSSPPRGIPTA